MESADRRSGTTISRRSFLLSSGGLFTSLWVALAVAGHRRGRASRRRGAGGSGAGAF